MAVGVGLVGLGMMGTTHFRAYAALEEADVVAVCDVQPRRRAGDWALAPTNIDTGAAERVDLSAVRVYESLDDLLGDGDVEIVDLCTPTYLHAPMAGQALDAGKHVFCEKPMARTSAEADGMIRAARKAARHLMIGHCLRFWPEYVMMKEMIDSGRFGTLRSALLTRLGPMPGWSWDGWLPDAARSGSAALDLHVHDTDLVQWYLGSPEAVAAHGAFDDAGGLVHVLTQYVYPDGPAVAAEGSWDLPPSYPFRMGARLVFEKAAVEFDAFASPSLVVYRPGGAAHPAVPKADAYAEELHYFARCVAEDRPPERVTAAEAAAAVRIVEAEIRSATTGRPVAVPP